MDDHEETEVKRRALPISEHVTLSSVCFLQISTGCLLDSVDSCDRERLAQLHVYSLKLPLCVEFVPAPLQAHLIDTSEGLYNCQKKNRPVSGRFFF